MTFHRSSVIERVGTDVLDPAQPESISGDWDFLGLLNGIAHLPTRARAERRLLAWFTRVAEHEVPELLRLARTLDAWRPELLAYFDTNGVSNGPTEAMNALIKKVKRVGHGFRNFDNYRLRLLLHRGVDWHTHTPTPIRGRLPRLAA
jgi:hypothetical protein